MSMYIIEKDVGIPAPKRNKYPWKQLEVGDSFFVPNQTAQKFSSNTNKISKSNRMDFTCKTTIKDGVKGVRVWRIK